MKKTAKQLAAQGRRGDTELLHVTREELAALHGLGSLFGKRITRNPRTGLPEAYDFKQLLPAAVGIGATVLSGGALSPLALGLLSGATSAAVTGDMRKGLTTGLLTGATAGLGQGLLGVAEGGSAAGAAADATMQGGAGMVPAAVTQGMGQAATQSAMQGVGQAATQGMGQAATQGALGVAAPQAMAGQSAAEMFSQGLTGGAGQLGSGYGGLLGNTAADTLGQAGNTAAANFGELGSGFANVGHDMAGQIGLNSAVDAGAGATAASGWTDPSAWKAQFGGDMLMKRTVPGLMALGSAWQSGLEMEPGEDQEPSEDAKKEKRMSRSVTAASDPYYAMNGGEHRYFSAPSYNYAEGGIVSLPNGQQADNGVLKVVRAIRSRYRSRQAAVEDMQVPNSFMQRLGVQNPNDPVLDYAFGYTKKQGNRKLKSGIMALAHGGAVEPVGLRVRKPSDDFRYMDAPPKQPEPQQSGMPVLDDKGVKSVPVQPPKKKPNRTMMAGGGPVQGPGDGMSDSVPATIEGQQPARLARDEFVVPADAVSHLGNGSSQAGHKQLYDMVARIRAARTGQAKQAPAVNPKKVMPV